MATKTLLTVEQFTALPDEERMRLELVEGELTDVSSGTPEHNLIRDRLLVRLWSFLEERKLGVVVSETDCRITGSTIRRPDLCFFTLDRWRSIDPRTLPVLGAPDIAIEVLSPSEPAVHVNRKVEEYLSGGSHEVWILDPANRSILVRTQTGIRILHSDDVLTSPTLEGFSVSVATVMDLP